jgi:hypothetical protein
MAPRMGASRVVRGLGGIPWWARQRTRCRGLCHGRSGVRLAWAVPEQPCGWRAHIRQERSTFCRSGREASYRCARGTAAAGQGIDRRSWASWRRHVAPGAEKCLSIGPRWHRSGISRPRLLAWARPSHGGARLIIVRSLDRIQAELSRETPAQTGFLGCAGPQAIAYCEFCGSVLEAKAPLCPPERQWSSCERRYQSLWPPGRLGETNASFSVALANRRDAQGGRAVLAPAPPAVSYLMRSTPRTRSLGRSPRVRFAPREGPSTTALSLPGPPSTTSAVRSRALSRSRPD